MNLPIADGTSSSPWGGFPSDGAMYPRKPVFDDFVESIACRNSSIAFIALSAYRARRHAIC